MTTLRRTKYLARSSPASDDRARLLEGIAVKEGRLDVNGIATSVMECGQGRPLVLLHGGIECGGVYWAPVI